MSFLASPCDWVRAPAAPDFAALLQRFCSAFCSALAARLREIFVRNPQIMLQRDLRRIANEGSSPYVKTRLKVVVLGARRISDQLAIANGLWQAVNDQGEVIDYGQWGNVWWIKAGEVKLLQESAGSYLP